MLSDAIATALPDLRAEAEANMASTCTVNAKGSGEPTTDPDTGVVTFPLGEEHYAGKCRVRPAGTQARLGNAGDAEVFAFDYVVSVPLSAASVTEGDIVTVTASLDPALVGVVVEVQKVDRGEQITARRLYCEDVA